MPPDVVVLPNEDGASGCAGLVAANQQENGSWVAEEALEQLEIALIEVKAPPAVAAPESHRDQAAAPAPGRKGTPAPLEPAAVEAGQGVVRAVSVFQEEGLERIHEGSESGAVSLCAAQ